MGRYFIEISYNGANYSGWQTQENAPSVQETLQSVARKILRQEVEVVGSSRTDAGVHAVAQIAQLDMDLAKPLDQLVFRLNMALPADIAVRRLIPVRPDAQCRYEAISRTYRYLISRKKDPFWHHRSHYWYGELNLDPMRECCKLLLNSLDFQAFSKIHTQVNHFECRILRAEWKQEGDLLIFEIKANRFLRGMVRALVGTMLEVGKGRKTVADFETILKGKDRKKAGENAPACGLYLMEVEYPDGVFL